MPPESPLHHALSAALDDEYRARAICRAAIDAFGPEHPFVDVIRSAQRHVDMLLGLFAARGLTPVADPYEAGLPAPPSIEDACRVAIQAETENAAVYGRLMTLVAGDAEVTWVLRILRRAAANCHLSAFRWRLDGRVARTCALCGFRPGAGPCRRGHDGPEAGG